METVVDGRYVLESQLAEGGMGQVYKARHVQLGKIFALKIIAPTFADDEVARQRFNQEAKLASEISHPGIVSVVDFGEDASVGAYMVMELVDGKRVLPQDGRPLSLKRALDVLGQVADVLDHIHKQGVFHGDVKADNILLCVENEGARRRDVVRLLDFGVAQRRGAEATSLDGTPHYLAPERAGGGPPSIAADVYALGVLGFQLLTGKVPFDGTMLEILMAHVEQEPPSIAAIRGEPVDPALESLIRHAMAKDPEERHASAAAFRYQLNAVMDMLALTRRRSGSIRPLAARETTMQLLFESSTLPQAVIAIDGIIGLANAPFAQLLGQECGKVERSDVCQSSLAACVPELMSALRTVQHDNRPKEVRALVERGAEPALELIVWLVPYAGESVHVLVRIDEVLAADIAKWRRRGRNGQ